MMNPGPASYPRPLPEDLPGFEVEIAVARMMDSPALWWRALAIYHQHFANWAASWHASRSDREAERKCVHALRSAAANIGAAGLAAAAARLEHALENALKVPDPAPQALVPLRANLQERFDEVRRSAERALTDVPPVPPSPQSVP